MHLDLLRVIQDGEEKPTRIMSRSNMTWSQLQRGLEFLVESSFVDEVALEDMPIRKRDNRVKKRYFVTEKGEAVLRYFRKELGMVESLISSI